MSKLMNGVNYQATGGAPAPPARDWRDGFAELERARAAYQQALRSGDVSAAEALAGEVSRLESTLQSEIAPLAGRAASHTPRPPAKGEETKLRKRLATVAEEIEKLESERAKLLVALAGEDCPDFQDVTRIDYELSRARYASEALQARLAEIERHRADQERAKRLQAELRARERKAAELKQATEALDGLAKEAVGHWESILRNFAAIRAGASEIGAVPEYWLGKFYEGTGAVKPQIEVYGIRNGLIFPVPEE